MLRVAILGLGFMGRFHLENYLRLESEGYPLKLAAIFDVSEDGFARHQAAGNLESATSVPDLSGIPLYTDLDQMLSEVPLDFADITLPTFLHCDYAVRLMRRGLHVLCEKPMALNVEEAGRMVRVAEQTGCKLMIAHCLRFWPEYEYLRKCIRDETFGKPVCGYFFRYSQPPSWSHDHWMRDVTKSGGCLLDIHVHDTDVIRWLFGEPRSVFTQVGNVLPRSKYDIVFTRYEYEDGKIIHAHANATYGKDFAFSAGYRVSFETGDVVYENGALTVYPASEAGFSPELGQDNAYYKEIKYFAECIRHHKEPVECPAADSYKTMILVEAERKSAERDPLSRVSTEDFSPGE